jgi:hypothetical protein
MKINLCVRVVYLKNVLGPSSEIESLGDLEKKELCNVTLLLLRFLFSDEPDTNLWDSHIGTGDASGWLATKQSQSHSPCEGNFHYGSEARILLHIWDYVFMDDYVILPFRVLTREDINRINNYTLRMKLVYRVVDSSNNPVVYFI